MNIVFLPGDIHILEPQNILGQTEDYKINMFCFTPKNVELNSRMEKMVGCPGVRIICPNGEISTCKLLFQGTVSYSAGRGLVRNKYQHHLKLACFCHDIDKKCVHLVVNNNHTPNNQRVFFLCQICEDYFLSYYQRRKSLINTSQYCFTLIFL